MLSIEFEQAIYPVEVLQRAALKFTDVCSFNFRIADAKIAVEIVPLNDSYALCADDFEGRYRNEVLDQHLRAIVAKETENERNLILAHAFSNSKLISA